MPLNLAHLVANHADLAVDFGNGDVLTISYLPAKITSQMLLDITAMSAAQQSSNPTPEQVQASIETPARILLSLLSGWDFVVTNAETGDEEPLPLTREALLSLGLAVIWQILNTIISAQTGEAPAAKA